jgi:hypothetical protein
MLFRLKPIFLTGGEQVFIIREEEDHFIEETYMEEQEKVRITAEEGWIFNQE